MAGGDERIAAERLTAAVAAFDEIQPLTMRELWRVPEALRVELCAAFASVGRRVVAAQRERLTAEDWVLSGARTGALRGQRSGAFFERALQLTHEQDLPSRAARWISGWAGAARTRRVIRLEHERQALDKLWLSNIMAGFRELEALNWAKCFDRLSRAEKLYAAGPPRAYTP